MGSHSPYSRKNVQSYSLLTAWSRVLLGKLTGFQLVKKFPAFYGTRLFITAFTSARQPSLFWDSLIQSIPPYPTSWRSVLILSSRLRLGLSSGHFPSCLPTKVLCRPVLSSTRTTCSSHLILLVAKSVNEKYKHLIINNSSR
jgi:hypothetical protein